MRIVADFAQWFRESGRERGAYTDAADSDSIPTQL